MVGEPLVVEATADDPEFDPRWTLVALCVSSALRTSAR
jgi:hypothetical protein